jgi:hypothetical protein
MQMRLAQVEFPPPSPQIFLHIHRLNICDSLLCHPSQAVFLIDPSTPDGYRDLLRDVVS